MTTTRLTGLYAMFAAAAARYSRRCSRCPTSPRRRSRGADRETVSAWAEPAQDLVGGLLTWASPERVYATYVQVFALLFPAVFLSARATRARRPGPAAASNAGAGGSRSPATGSRPAA